MLFQKQLYRHDPQNGVYGDCYRTAIACLLNKPAGEVPHFFSLQNGAITSEEAHKLASDYLATQGLATFTVGILCDDLNVLLDAMQKWNPDLYYLLSGESERGTNHTVVCLGGRIIWDPFTGKSDCGLIGPTKTEGVNSLYWIEVLMPASIHKQQEKNNG